VTATGGLKENSDRKWTSYNNSKKIEILRAISFLNNYFQERETKGNIETQAEVDFDDERTQDLMETENENSQFLIT
jgi:hypothetical protein